MAPIKAKLEGWNTRLPENHPLAIESTRLYAETYQRLVEIVTRICKAKNIGLAIRAKLESNGIIVEGSSVLQLSDRPVVYSDVPDLTDEVIAELDRYDQEMKARSAADVDGPWVDRPGQQTELLLRYKKLWTTPIVELSNAMLATFLRQRIALRLVVPEAQKRLDSAFVDGTELYDKELSESLHKAITTK
jgi:hypothetical protein